MSSRTHLAVWECGCIRPNDRAGTRERARGHPAFGDASLGPFERSRSGRWFSMRRTARYHMPRGGGHNVLNGALGVVNLHDDPVADCCTASHLRLIIPSKGDSNDLPAFGQLGASVLCDDEVLQWSGADWKCHFCKLVASWVAGGPDLPMASNAVKVVGRKNCCLQWDWPNSELQMKWRWAPQ